MASRGEASQRWGWQLNLEAKSHESGRLRSEGHLRLRYCAEPRVKAHQRRIAGAHTATQRGFAAMAGKVSRKVQQASGYTAAPMVRVNAEIKNEARERLP